MPAVTRAAIGGGTNSRASALLDIFRGADSRGPETGTFVSNINSLFEGTGATSTQPAKTSAAARVSTTSPRFAMPHAMLTVGTGSPVRKWKCDGVVRSFVDARGAKMWLITVPAEIPTCSPNVSSVSSTGCAAQREFSRPTAHDAAALALLRGWSEYHITMRASPENLTTSPPYSRTLFTMISRYELTTPAKTCGPRSPSTCATEEYPLMSTNMTAASSCRKDVALFAMWLRASALAKLCKSVAGASHPGGRERRRLDSAERVEFSIMSRAKMGTMGTTRRTRCQRDDAFSAAFPQDDDSDGKALLLPASAKITGNILTDVVTGGLSVGRALTG
eukprot:PhM_4_TR3048/c0_g1_i9/m.45193